MASMAQVLLSQAVCTFSSFRVRLFRFVPALVLCLAVRARPQLIYFKSF